MGALMMSLLSDRLRDQTGEVSCGGEVASDLF